ncbi:class I SAM-dependent methyltransferase [Orrella sp. NBD-18]|uniref:Class I SAM-dependent methyltransferase n=1 Tax=Sheuella amnicola TaxID=2707330 RepID=A0A6B2QW79_9BURK|nr:class I SAM-dependent methyltransferase [Sheuella amnicola]NDY82203.1 class I SAM-dependent methyltransferase [Sheuella amnicola]
MFNKTTTMLCRIIILAMLSLVIGKVCAQTPHTHQHSFSNASQWAQVFDDPERDKWQQPHQVIQALEIKPDSIVADIGSGTGYFATRLAHMVPQGAIYGVDAEPEMVNFLKERAEKLGLKNLYSIQGSAESPRLPKKVDLILFVDVYHHIEKRIGYLKAVRSSLNDGGRIAVIDFRQDSPIGPPVKDRFSSSQVVEEFKQAGFSLIKENEFLPNQYFLIFK